MKKEEIIRLAKENKFISKVLYNNAYKYSNNEDKRWLFWLTELQRWLKINHGIVVWVDPFFYDGWNYNVQGFLPNGDKIIFNVKYDEKSFISALEICVTGGLKMI